MEKTYTIDQVVKGRNKSNDKEINLRFPIIVKSKTIGGNGEPMYYHLTGWQCDQIEYRVQEIAKKVQTLIGQDFNLESDLMIAQDPIWEIDPNRLNVILDDYSKGGKFEQFYCLTLWEGGSSGGWVIPRNKIIDIIKESVIEI